MGQKVHPIAFRLAVTKDWQSRWYAPESTYADQLHADLKVRKYLEKRLQKGAVSRVIIERAWNSVRVTLHTSRPGMIIGKRGQEIEVMTDEISKMCGGAQVKIDITEIRQPELDAAWVAAQVPHALLLGPDEEAAQWVGVAAATQGLEHAVCRKHRRGDREVDVALPMVDVEGRAVVLFDDVASTGRTLVAAARGAFEQGAATVDVAVTHALFIGDALLQIRAAGVRHIWSSDCVPHASNVVTVVPLLAAALRDPDAC